MCKGFSNFSAFLHHFVLAKLGSSSIRVKPYWVLKLSVKYISKYYIALGSKYGWTWIWRTTVQQIFAYDGTYAWSQSDAYQVFVICIRRILHMTDQFSWSHWVCHIQVYLYLHMCQTKRQLWVCQAVSCEEQKLVIYWPSLPSWSTCHASTALTSGTTVKWVMSQTREPWVQQQSIAR